MYGGRKERDNPIVVSRRKADIINMLLDGKSSTEMLDYICSKYNLARNIASVYINAGRKEIKKYREQQADFVISTHIERYEKIYAELHKIRAFVMAMTAMEYKEKLLGMHKQDFKLNINNIQSEVNISSRSEPSYKFDSLSSEKKKRFNELLNKANGGKFLIENE